MQVREFSPDMVDDVRRLFASRDLPFSTELQQWKWRCPGMKAWVGVNEADEIVGYYSVLPLQYPSTVLRLGYGIDAIVHPNYSTIPNIAALIESGVGWALAEGFDALIAVPNQRMTQIKRFLGWTVCTTYQRWTTAPSRAQTLQVISSPALPPHVMLTPYGAWRWSIPRPYDGILDTDGRLLGLVHQHEGEALLIWTADAEATRAIANELPVQLLLHNEAGSFPGMLGHKTAGHFALLYRNLRDCAKVDNAIQSRDVWLFEPIEGVTLGW